MIVNCGVASRPPSKWHMKPKHVSVWNISNLKLFLKSVVCPLDSSAKDTIVWTILARFTGSNSLSYVFCLCYMLLKANVVLLASSTSQFLSLTSSWSRICCDWILWIENGVRSTEYIEWQAITSSDLNSPLMGASFSVNRQEPTFWVTVPIWTLSAPFHLSLSIMKSKLASSVFAPICRLSLRISLIELL